MLKLQQLLLQLILLCISSPAAHSYSAPVVANDTFCDFELIRQVEVGDAAVPAAQPTLLPSSGKSLLDLLPDAWRPYRDGPLVLEGQHTFKWYSPRQACEALSQPPTTVLFVGDSLTRHFMQVLARSSCMQTGGALCDMHGHAWAWPGVQCAAHNVTDSQLYWMAASCW